MRIVAVYIHIPREASTVCSFYSDGHYQSLGKWNGQHVRHSRFVFYNAFVESPKVLNLLLMKKNLLLLLAVFLALPELASSADLNALRIHCKSGEDVIILLDSSPVVRFDDLNLIISSDHNVLNLQSEEALKFIYENIAPDGIGKADISDVVFNFGKEKLTINNLTPQISISIFTIDGLLVSSAITDNNGNATLSLPSQSSTVYILQTPNFSFKLLRP